MRKHRTLTLTGAGSAIAACIAGTAMLITASSSQTVEAAMIFASFRDAVSNAFELTLKDIGDEGVHVNGRIVVIFETDEENDATLNSPMAGAFVDLSVYGDEDADEVAGLELDIQAAAVPGNEWAYVKLNKLPMKLIEEQPMAMIFATIARNGILVKLDGVLTAEMLGMGGLSRLGMFAGGPCAQGGDDGDDDGSAVGISFGSDDDLRCVLAGILSGKATREDIDRLVAKLAEEIDDVSVRDEGNGLHVLTASGFDDDDAVKNAELEIAYREGKGIEWARIEHIGAYDGAIRFERTDATLDDPMFDAARFTEDGTTQVFDLANIKSMFEAMGGAKDQ